MSKQQIFDALWDDPMIDYMQPWQLNYIINFVIDNYDKNRDN